MIKHIFLGIDPGQTGAMAVLSDHTKQAIYDFDDQLALRELAYFGYLLEGDQRDIIKRFEIKAAIEKVSAMPKQGVSSTFKFGTNFGIWQGRLEAFQIPFIFVTPGKWRKVVFDSMAKLDDKKQMSLDLARRLFPWAELHLKKHHNRADALLIAEYLRRMDKQSV